MVDNEIERKLGTRPPLGESTNVDHIACPKCQNTGKDKDFDGGGTHLVCDWCYFYACPSVWLQLEKGLFFKHSEIAVIKQLIGGYGVVGKESRTVIEKINSSQLEGHSE